ncbi:hypothetical protein PIB30_069690 [Stylosanthes scabra]|uniref:Uncharacterized protein n=1 Tax=Stylosanthes scabra TaxID=79078 RepID=A0ABU6YM51_9FABA|nr:hypothetical protein [Stylosanthes scabra]
MRHLERQDRLLRRQGHQLQNTQNMIRQAFPDAVFTGLVHVSSSEDDSDVRDSKRGWLGLSTTLGQTNNLRAKFGAEVANESARNEKIAKKSLKAKSRAYAYALPCLGRHVLAGTGQYAYAPKGPIRMHQ